MQRFNNLQSKALRIASQMRSQNSFSMAKNGLLLPTQKAPFGGMMGMGELADRQAAAAHAEQGADDAIDLWEMENRSGILLTI